MPDLAIDRALAAVRSAIAVTGFHAPEVACELEESALAILEAAWAWATEIRNVPPKTTGHVFDEVAITPIELALWRTIRGEAP